MSIMQSWNSKTKAYVKYSKEGNVTKLLDVKQRQPSKPFKGVTIIKKKKKGLF